MVIGGAVVAAATLGVGGWWSTHRSVPATPGAEPALLRKQPTLEEKPVADAPVAPIDPASSATRVPPPEPAPVPLATTAPAPAPVSAKPRVKAPAPAEKNAAECANVLQRLSLGESSAELLERMKTLGCH